MKEASGRPAYPFSFASVFMSKVYNISIVRKLKTTITFPTLIRYTSFYLCPEGNNVMHKLQRVEIKLCHKGHKVDIN